MPDGFLAFDVELVYQGRASFTIETRLDLKDSPYFKFGRAHGGGEGEEEEMGALEEALGKEFDGLVAAEEGPREDRSREGEREGERQREKEEERGQGQEHGGGEELGGSSGSAHGGRVSSPTGGARDDRNASVGTSPKQGTSEREDAGVRPRGRGVTSFEPERAGS